MSKEHSPNNGGPAFPVITDGRDPWGKLTIDPRSPGMTLRDYFAGQAVGCFSMGPDDVQKLLHGTSPRHDVVAKFCYGLADAMLAARDGKGDA